MTISRSFEQHVRVGEDEEPESVSEGHAHDFGDYEPGPTREQWIEASNYSRRMVLAHQSNNNNDGGGNNNGDSKKKDGFAVSLRNSQGAGELVKRNHEYNSIRRAEHYPPPCHEVAGITWRRDREHLLTVHMMRSSRPAQGESTPEAANCPRGVKPQQDAEESTKKSVVAALEERYYNGNVPSKEDIESLVTKHEAYTLPIGSQSKVDKVWTR